MNRVREEETTLREQRHARRDKSHEAHIWCVARKKRPNAFYVLMQRKTKASRPKIHIKTEESYISREGRMTKDKREIVACEQGNTVTFQCHALTETNYTTWSIMIETVLRAYGHWNAITEDEVAKHKNAKDVWESIKVRYIGAELVQKTRLQILRNELEMLKMNDNESINDFAGKISGIVAKIKSLGSTLEEEKQCGRVKAYEERLQIIEAKDEEQGKLLLAIEQKHGENSGSEKGCRRNFDRGGRGRGRGKGRGRGDKSGIRCHDCGEFGHFSYECTKWNDKDNEAISVIVAKIKSLGSTLEEEKRCGRVKAYEERLQSLKAKDEEQEVEEVEEEEEEEDVVTKVEFDAMIVESLGILAMNEVDEKKNYTTKGINFQTLPENVLLQVAKHKNTKDVWESIKVWYIGAERVQKARLQILRNELEMLKMNDNESINDFAGKINGIVAKIKSLGSTLEEEVIVRKFLNSVPKKYLPIVAPIEQYSDLESMPFEEAVGRVKAYRERLQSLQAKDEEQGKLLLAIEQNHSENSGCKRNFNRGRRGRGRGRGRGDKSGIRCYDCEEFGNFSYECTK
uniref:Zinc finger, CCHC-type n=1 Tax=Tanacetum cinerariifolium TaxID=118510 RepID=A0A6L2P5Z5_TANCI|nr:zinc finger, CCHC-type [Tanacetum cinerariifolium]